MATRGFVGFVVDGTEKIAYNHFDSHPGGLGCDVLAWLESTDLSDGALADQARALKVVTDEVPPSDEDIERLKPFTNLNVGERGGRPDWYQLLRETQGNPAKMLEAGAIEDASSFPADSLFAEWGYVIDFDTSVFDVYRGFQQGSHNAGRFADRRMERSNGYGPVALVASWPLTELPDKAAFMLATEGPEDDE